MSLLPILVAILGNIKDLYFSHTFIFLFFTIPVVFVIVSIVLVIVTIDDPNNRPFSPTDEEGSIFLNPDSPCSPSNESVSSISADLNTRFIPRSLERRVSEANVERLLAAHRERFSDNIWDERTYFYVDPRDAVQRVEEGDESEDEGATDAPSSKPVILDASKPLST